MPREAVALGLPACVSRGLGRNRKKGSTMDFEISEPIETKKPPASAPDGGSLPAVKPIVPLDRRDKIGFVLLAASVFLFMDFALYGGFALGFSIAYGVLFILTTVYLAGRRPTGFGLFCGILSLAAAAVPALYRDTFLNVLIVCLDAFLYSVYAGDLCGAFAASEGMEWIERWFQSTVIAPFRHAAEPFRSVVHTVRNGRIAHLGQILLGLLLAVPVLMMVVPLLMQADAAYESMMSGLAARLGGLVPRLILTALAAPLVISFAFAHRKALETPSAAARNTRMQVAGAPLLTALLTLLSLVYISYLLSQLAYFFSAFSGMMPAGSGLTSSAYARRGFFELVAISAINLTLLLLVQLVGKRGTNGEIPAVVKTLSLFIGGFTLLLAATALSKMVLYIRLYGMTRLRMLTSVFMIALAVTLVFVLFRLFFHRFPLVRSVIAVAAMLFVSMAFADVDRFVSSYNVQAYQDGRLKEIDVEHLGRLSVSAVPAVVRLLDDTDPQVAAEAGTVLRHWTARLTNESFRAENGQIIDRRGFSLRSFNLAEERAYELIREHYPRFALSENGDVS